MNMWEEEIRQFERDDAQKFPPRGAVLFVGSSSIRLWEDLATDFAGIETVRRGFGGSQLRDANYFYDRIVAQYAPRAIVLYDAGNDLEDGRKPAQIRDDFVQFVSSTRNCLPQTPVFYLSAKLEPSRIAFRDDVILVNALIKAFCDANSDAHFIDVMSSLLDENGEPDLRFYEEDGVHINRRGYEAWTKIIRAKLDEIVPH